MPGSEGFTTWPIQQESTFWRRDLWEEAGGALDTSFSLAADFELWMRFARLAEPVAISVPLAGFRRHGDQKTSKFSAAYAKQAKTALVRNGGKIASGLLRSFARDRLPAALQPAALKIGFLHHSHVISRSRDNTRWVLVQTVL